MNRITKTSGPQKCTYCLQDWDEIYREHVLTNNSQCCPQCPMRDAIAQAIARKRSQSRTIQKTPIRICRDSVLVNQGTSSLVTAGRSSKSEKISSDTAEMLLAIIVFAFIILSDVIAYFIFSQSMDWGFWQSIIGALGWPFVALYYLVIYIMG